MFHHPTNLGGALRTCSSTTNRKTHVHSSTTHTFTHQLHAPGTHVVRTRTYCISTYRCYVPWCCIRLLTCVLIRPIHTGRVNNDTLTAPGPDKRCPGRLRPRHPYGGTETVLREAMQALGRVLICCRAWGLHLSACTLVVFDCTRVRACVRTRQR